MLKQLFYSGPSIEVLQEEYAKKGRIDDKAAVKASHGSASRPPSSASGSF